MIAEPTLETAQTTGTVTHRTTTRVRNARGPLSYRVHLSRRPAAAGHVRPLFVMVHGIGMSHRYYDKLQRTLLEHGDTLVLDLPGFGGMPRPKYRLSVQDYAAVIAQALDEVEADRCVLIGHSMGAQFVTELAIDRPDLVSQLVVIGPVTDVEHRSSWKHMLMLIADTLIELPVTNLMVGTAYAECGIRWYLQELPVMLGYQLEDRLPLASCPVLVLRGTRDNISGHDWCEKLSCNARMGDFVEISGQPHAAHRGGATAITAAILTAVEKHTNGHTPAQATQRPHPAESRWRTHPEVLHMASITEGDRQCRSYFIGHGTSVDRTVRIVRSDRLNTPVKVPVPVFVLVHGIGMSHRYFRRLGAVLSTYGDVHLVDLPGYGWTGRPAHASSNEATADLIGKLLDDVGASSCILIGHSMGVQSATELAIARPDLVSCLVLIGAAVDVDHRTAYQQAVRLGINSIFEKPLLSMVQSFDVLRCGPRWYLAQLKLAMSYPLEDRLPLAEQPVLVLRGSRDVVAGATWSDRLARTAHHGETGTIHGAPHAAHHSAAGAVATAIARFVRRQEPGLMAARPRRT